MLTDEELLTFIKNKCRELGVTGYDLAKSQLIDFSEQTAYRILDGTTKNPRRKNLIQIFNYLEDKVVATDLKSSYQKPEKSVTYQVNEEEFIAVQEQVEAMYKKVSLSEIFSDIGTELLISYKKQITIFELNTELFKKNSILMEEKIQSLNTQISIN